jgi:hypothetical protein
VKATVSQLLTDFGTGATVARGIWQPRRAEPAAGGCRCRAVAYFNVLRAVNPQGP